MFHCINSTDKAVAKCTLAFIFRLLMCGPNSIAWIIAVWYESNYALIMILYPYFILYLWEWPHPANI